MGSTAGRALQPPRRLAGSPRPQPASHPACQSLSCCPRAAREAGVALGAAVPRKDLQVGGAQHGVEPWVLGGWDEVSQQDHVCCVLCPPQESREAYPGLHVRDGSGGWPHLVQTACPFALFSAKYAKCDQCGNPKGNRCVFNLCRGCCKKRAFKETADCPGHGLLFKTKLERSLVWKGAQPRLQEPQQAGPGEPGGFPEVVGSALA